jgi:hypothetical protein
MSNFQLCVNAPSSLVNTTHDENDEKKIIAFVFIHSEKECSLE